MKITKLDLSRTNENDIDGGDREPSAGSESNSNKNYRLSMDHCDMVGDHLGQLEEGGAGGGGGGTKEKSGGGRNSPGIDQVPVKRDRGKRRAARRKRLGLTVPIDNQNDTAMTDNPESTRPGAYPFNGDGFMAIANETAETISVDGARGGDDGASHVLVANAVLFDPAPTPPTPTLMQPPPLAEASELPPLWSRKLILSLAVLLIALVATLSTAIPLAILADISDNGNEDDDTGSGTDSPIPSGDNDDVDLDGTPPIDIPAEGPTPPPTAQIPTIPTLPPSFFDGEWILSGEIDGEDAFDVSGSSVSLSSEGDVLAIGAFRNDGNGSASGHVRVFEFIENTWTQRGEDIDGEATDDRSGISVSLSSNGNILAIGAFRNGRNGNDSGHARVFEYIDGQWTQRGEDIDGEASGDLSGLSVSLSSQGNVLAVSGFRNDGNGEDSGHVRVFEYRENIWGQRGNDIDGEAAGDLSGYRVSLSSEGNVLAIGAPDNDGNGVNSGHVRVYQYENDVWAQKGGDIDGEAPGDQNGWSVSLSSNGNILAAGAISNDGNGTNSGHVRVYEFIEGDWAQRGDDIEGEATGDSNGWSVSLSSDGSVLAIGAIRNDGNGSNSGLVRVYGYTNDSWIQRSSDIDGEAPEDGSGDSVFLSADGNVLAIGAVGNDGNGEDSGHVRVYRFG